MPVITSSDHTFARMPLKMYKNKSKNFLLRSFIFNLLKAANPKGSSLRADCFSDGNGASYLINPLTDKGLKGNCPAPGPASAQRSGKKAPQDPLNPPFAKTSSFHSCLLLPTSS